MSMELRSPFAKALLVLACLVVLMAGIKAASTIMVPFFFLFLLLLHVALLSIGQAALGYQSGYR